MKACLTSLLAIALVVAGAGCGRFARHDVDAEKVVSTYLKKLIDAYGASDAEIVAPLVSDKQGLKLTGLIGVKRDGGIKLDAQLVDIRFEKIERDGDAVRVDTRERWHYRDVSLASGQQVGEDSFDAYHVRYHLARRKDAWIVEQLEFLEPPQVGRKAAPVAVDPRVLHGLTPREDPASPKR